MPDQGFRLHPEQASSHAPAVDALYFYLTIVSVFFTVLILALIAGFAIKYRQRSSDNADLPRPILGSVKLELLWAGVPLFFALTFFFWGARLYFAQLNPPADTLDIHVTGKQWMWMTQHPNGTREINALHVPRGRRVKLIIGSQDVIHSFFIPAFRTKMDAVPGRYTVTWFEPTRVGEYHLFCAEYCGTLHSGMVGRVVVLEPEEYQSWLAGTAANEPPAVAGARLFQSLGCATCHAAQAPTMAGLYGSAQRLADGATVRADEAYLRESILDSTAKIVQGYQPIMPSFRGQLSEEQLYALIAYIKSLREARLGAEQAPPPVQPESGETLPLRPVAPYNPGPANTVPEARQP